MPDFERQTDSPEADWDDIEFELECSGREAGISGVTFGTGPGVATPWPAAALAGTVAVREKIRLTLRQPRAPAPATPSGRPAGLTG